MLRPLRRLRTLPEPIERLLDDGARCWDCPLGRNGGPGRPVLTEWLGSGSPPVALVGEAPGRMECQRGRPFIGPSGKLLGLACTQGGVDRPTQLAILNAAACGPIPRHEDATKAAAVAACRPRLIAELRRLAPSTILAIGASALRALSAPKTPGVTLSRGALVKLHPDIGTPAWQPYLLPTFHPAHIFSGGDGEFDELSGESGPAVDLLYYFLQADLHKAVQLALGNVKPWTDELDLFALQPRGAPTGPVAGLYRVGILEDGLAGWGDPAGPEEVRAALQRVMEDARDTGGVAIDVETDGKNSLAANLTAIALATPRGGVSATWAVFQADPQLRQVLLDICANPLIRKTFHNCTFDLLVLDRHGFPVSGPVGDTMLQHHAAYPGLAHKLDQVAQQFFCTPPWKAEFRSSVKSLPELITYNGRDAQATARLEPVLEKIVNLHRGGLCYEVDRQLARVAARMRQVGYFVDREEQARQSRIQHARLDYMRVALAKDFGAIEEPWRQALARYRAARVRKHDPENYAERVEKRLAELADRPRNDERDVGVLKPKAKDDLVALFEVLRIPITGYTPKGAPVTDKKAMETAAARHPLMRSLIHLREAQNTLALFIDGLPIVEDGRVHPDWNVAKVTGRWSAGKAQNWQYDVPGWPPAKDEKGEWRHTPSGEYVTVHENPRAQVTAPTVKEILALPAGTVPFIIRARARMGHGRILIGADFDQLELRIVGWLAKEPFLLDGFARKFDPHSEFAKVCFRPVFGELCEEFAARGLKPKVDLSKLDLDDIAKAKLKRSQQQWKRLRDLCKRCEYGAIYGGDPHHLHEMLVKDFPELTLTNVQRTVEVIEAKMPGVVAQRRRWEIEARERREIREAILGRARLFPLGNFNPNVVYNFPVQAMAASLLGKAILRFTAVTRPALLQLEPLYRLGLLDGAWVRNWRRTLKGKALHAPVELILNGHDSLIAESDEEDGKDIRDLLEDAMTQTVTDGRQTLAFTAEASTGRRWSDT